MFKKVLEYAGEYRKTTYQAMIAMLIGMVMNVVPFLFIYQLICPLLLREPLDGGYVLWRLTAIALCGIFMLCFTCGDFLFHRCAYHTLKNLHISLQTKLEKQP